MDKVQSSGAACGICPMVAETISATFEAYELVFRHFNI